MEFVAGAHEEPGLTDGVVGQREEVRGGDGVARRGVRRRHALQQTPVPHIPQPRVAVLTRCKKSKKTPYSSVLCHAIRFARCNWVERGDGVGRPHAGVVPTPDTFSCHQVSTRST